jgi:histidyl-tRNA synthetase
MRMVVEQRLDKGALPIKLWYAGPFFRAERPQHGRYRQLQQVGIEAIGIDDPALDAEVVALADEAYRKLGLTQFTLNVTSLGCGVCRPDYRERLMVFLDSLDLDEATRERAVLNPLRVLDDKRDDVQSKLIDAPLMVNHLCADCSEHYDLTREYLRAQGVTWREAPRLVRGLDYYTKTTFEFNHPLLGAQSGIGGGGRYDGLMESIGGDSLSGIGFGLGTDRTLLACEAEGIDVVPGPRIDAFLVPMGADARMIAVNMLAQLRAQGVRCDMSFGDRAMKGAMKAADRSGAPVVLIIGEYELAAGIVTVKNMQDGVQSTVPLADVVTLVSTMAQINPLERQPRS